MSYGVVLVAVCYWVLLIVFRIRSRVPPGGSLSRCDHE